MNRHRPPKAIWEYDLLTSAYSEEPTESWQRIFDHVKDLYPDSQEKNIVELIGKKPVDYE